MIVRVNEVLHRTVVVVVVVDSDRGSHLQSQSVKVSRITGVGILF